MKINAIKKTTCIFVALLFSVSGCARNPGIVTLSFNEDIVDTSRKCEDNYIKVINVLDKRTNKENVGLLSSTVVAKDIIPWIKSSIEAINNIKLEKHAKKPIILYVSLKKMHVTSSHYSRVATIILDVEYYDESNIFLTKTYRGSEISFSWNDSSNEIKNRFKEALKKAIYHIEKDLVDNLVVQR